MELRLFQVDAFASAVFGGNPAAVMPLDRWLPDALLQSIAAENNLAETAFFVPNRDGFDLRWFTPTVEVDLCGHATLATAFVLWERLGYAAGQISFDTRSGRLHVTRSGGRLWLDFPSRPLPAGPIPDALAGALGGAPVECLSGWVHILVYATAAEVAALQPDMRALRAVDHFAVIATAPGEDCDFVSRFFAPRQGIDEDPVTGSAHCSLTPYWASRLGRAELRARQISSRGGELICRLDGDRVRIGGRAVLYLEGTASLPE
jgi:predicted PhzF superfamily epimerase YddE/YHI9